MTVAAQTPPLMFDTIEEAVHAVRQGGMRLSAARRLVLEAFFAADGPVSAGHLAQTLSIDESFVYRNLEVCLLDPGRSCLHRLCRVGASRAAARGALATWT